MRTKGFKDKAGVKMQVWEREQTHRKVAPVVVGDDVIMLGADVTMLGALVAPVVVSAYLKRVFWDQELCLLFLLKLEWNMPDNMELPSSNLQKYL